MKPQRGPQHPLAQNGRQSEPQPWFFGIRCALGIANGDAYRLPVAFGLMRPQSHREYPPENVLCRERGSHCRPATWATRSIVEGAAAYGSQANMQLVPPRDADDPERRGGFGCAIARTWHTVEGKALKDVVTHMPRTYSQRTRGPRLPGAHGRKTCWIFSTRLCLRHIGNVPVGRSKKRAERRPEADEKPGDQAGRVAPATGGVRLATQVARGANP